MKRITLMAVALALFSEYAIADDLTGLINQNVKDATSFSERNSEPVQLWIHFRSDSQKRIGEEILDRVKDTNVGEKSIEQKKNDSCEIWPPSKPIALL
jgi:hypothetical protein